MFGNGPAPANITINVAFQFGFVRCLCGFVLGMMLYQGYRDGWAKSWLASGYTLLALILGLCLCMYFAIPDVSTVGFFPLILLSAAYGSQPMNRVFGTNHYNGLATGRSRFIWCINRCCSPLVALWLIKPWASRWQVAHRPNPIC